MLVATLAFERRMLQADGKNAGERAINSGKAVAGPALESGCRLQTI